MFRLLGVGPEGVPREVDRLLADADFVRRASSEQRRVLGYLHVEIQVAGNGLEADLLFLAQTLGLASTTGEPLVPDWLRERCGIPQRISILPFVKAAACDARALVANALRTYEPNWALHSIKEAVTAQSWV